MLAIYLLSALFFKHLIVDFFMQPAYMYLNKGTLFHPGGHMHAGLHALVTIYILYIASIGLTSSLLFVVFLLEYFSHYAMDYTKVNICKAYNWKPDNSPKYWYMLGIDQAVHSFTYIFIVAMVI